MRSFRCVEVLFDHLKICMDDGRSRATLGLCSVSVCAIPLLTLTRVGEARQVSVDDTAQDTRWHQIMLQ